MECEIISNLAKNAYLNSRISIVSPIQFDYKNSAKERNKLMHRRKGIAEAKPRGQAAKSLISHLRARTITNYLPINETVHFPLLTLAVREITFVSVGSQKRYETRPLHHSGVYSFFYYKRF